MFVNNAMSSCFAITKPMILTRFHHNACDDTLWILSCMYVITWHQSSCLVNFQRTLVFCFWQKFALWWLKISKLEYFVMAWLFYKKLTKKQGKFCFLRKYHHFCILLKVCCQFVGVWRKL
jgi:predicted membrane channel-forming protein YqfA (hemolysin III family)